MLTIPLDKFCNIDNTTFTAIETEVLYNTNYKFYNLYIEIWIGSIPISQNLFKNCLADIGYHSCYDENFSNGAYKEFSISFDTRDNPSIRSSLPDSLSYNIKVSTKHEYAQLRPMYLACHLFVEKLDDIKRVFIIEERNLIYRVIYEQTERNRVFLKKWIDDGSSN